MEVPCEAFLYKFPSSVVKLAAHNVFGKYDISSTRFGTLEKFQFSGEHINPLLLGNSKITFWIESQGEDKSILYLSAFNTRTGAYVPAMRHAVVINKIKDYLNAIEVECIDISHQLFLAEQYQRVLELDKEIRELYEELQRLEEEVPTPSTQIHRTRIAIRAKENQLRRETAILEQLKNDNY